MNVVTNTWHQLVRRRLWPVALLLVAALAAVPFVLASEPEPVVPPVVPMPAVSADDEIAEPVVAKVEAKDRIAPPARARVRKDPFKPAPVKKAKKATHDDDDHGHARAEEHRAGSDVRQAAAARPRRRSPADRAATPKAPGRLDHRPLRRRHERGAAQRRLEPSSRRCPTTRSR